MYILTPCICLRGRLPKGVLTRGMAAARWAVGMPHPLAQGTQGNMQGTSGSPATGSRIFALFCAAPKQASRTPTDLSPLFACLLPVAAPSSLTPSTAPQCLASHCHQRNDQLSLASCPSSTPCTLPPSTSPSGPGGFWPCAPVDPIQRNIRLSSSPGRLVCLPWLHALI